ncbi:hypothetical protein MAP00_009103 [Monascus purpureus]|nr:hypothetical protein MAP00_009103 [Monascus purpureus]
MRDSSIRQGELLYTCHAKLREEISNKNPNLRVLVGHANLLEMLVLRFTEMEHGKIADASFILEQLVERVKRKIRSGTDTEPLSDTAESDIKGSDVIKGGNTYQEEIATSEPSSHDVEESPATISTTHEEKDRVDAYEKKWRSTYLVHLENSCAAD